MPAKRKKANDACARKVKARYKVWPSAYASGAVAKCRKVGAKNWGNNCLLYTSPSPRDAHESRMPSSA